MKRILWFSILITITSLVISCGDSQSTGEKGVTELELSPDTASVNSPLSTQNSGLKPALKREYPAIPGGAAEPKVKTLAKYVMNGISNVNWTAVAAVTHPDHPVVISPTVNVDANSVAINGRQLKKLYKTDSMIVWTRKTASGEPINLQFKKYVDQYIWDHNYLEAELHVNKFISRGPTANTLKEFFSGAEVVEAFVQKEDELNWQALNLIFRKVEGKYFLVGLVHDQHSL